MARQHCGLVPFVCETQQNGKSTAAIFKRIYIVISVFFSLLLLLSFGIIEDRRLNYRRCYTQTKKNKKQNQVSIEDSSPTNPNENFYTSFKKKISISLTVAKKKKKKKKKSHASTLTTRLRLAAAEAAGAAVGGKRSRDLAAVALPRSPRRAYPLLPLLLRRRACFRRCRCFRRTWRTAGCSSPPASAASWP